MALFGRVRGKRPRVLHAAGTRIDLTNRDAVRRLATSRTAQAWQADAWGYRDMIGELRFATQFKARAVARVKFFAAQVVQDEDEPIPFDSDNATIASALAKAADEEMARLPLDAGYRFVGVLDENLSITGECWLHGYQDEAGEECWEVLSVSEVVLGQDGSIGIRRHGEGEIHPVDPNGEEEMLRLWVPHPRWGNLADSPMRAVQDVCEDIILAGREMRAVARSRIASNGLFKIPRGLALLLAGREDMISADSNGFMAELTAALTAPIANEGHPGAVAPAGIIGELEDLAGFDHLRIDRESSEDIIQKVEQGLARLARGLDIPPEIITGMADANHWSAWQIDSSTYRYHIDPSVRTVADALTEAFLRPALLARGFSLADVRQVTVWRDAGVLTENPNRGQDAKDAFDRGSIGFKALNSALGFTDADMPDDDELIKMVAFKIGVDTTTSAVLLRAVVGNVVPEPQQPPTQPEPRVIEAQRTDQIQPGETPPNDGTPNSQPPGMTAGAQALVNALFAANEPDTWTTHEDESRALMDIDRALMDRLLVAAEEALARGLEKAGARVRSKLNGATRAALRASLADVPVEHLAAHIGPEGCMKLGIGEHELLQDVFARLEQNWNAWVHAGIGEGIRVALAILGLKRGHQQANIIETRLSNAMHERMAHAWAWLRDQLTAVAERTLYHPDDTGESRGEKSRFRIPAGVIRRAIGMVGGTPTQADAEGPEPPAGLATGQEITAALIDNGAAQLGFQWIYGVADRDQFHPHYALDGERFPEWTDSRLATPAQYAWVGPYFHPGDHGGCQCSYMPMWVTPDTPQEPRSFATRVRALRDRWLRRNRG